MAISIRCAINEDIVKVKNLLERYHAKNLIGNERDNGFVTTDMTVEQLQSLSNTEQGVTIAVDDENGNVVGLLIGASWGFLKSWPMFDYMQEILDEYKFNNEQLSKDSSYQYGPICIAEEYRGQGIGEQLLDYQRKLFSQKYPTVVTFINRVNPRSYAFHTRSGFTDVGEFHFNNNTYHMLAIATK